MKVGQSGQGDTIIRRIPTVISSVLSVTQVSFGQYHAFILNSSHTFAFGANSDGRLGLGDTNSRNVPTSVPITNVRMVACGYIHTLAVLNDGRVFSTGNNGNGRLGLNDESPRSSFTQISSPTNIVWASGGNDFSLIVGSDGKIYSFGNNNQGQLGLGDNTQKTVPTQISSLTNIFRAHACMDWSAVVVNTAGNIFTFGQGNSGRLGHGDQNNQLSPKQISGISGVSEINCGACHVLYVLNGELWGFGCGSNGRLGMGADTSNRLSPQKVGGITGVTKVSTGEDYSIVITNQTKAFSFGSNSFSQLGLNDTTQRNVPTQITSIRGVINFDTGFKSSIIVAQTNLFCFNKSASDPSVCYGFGFCNSTNQCVCDSTIGYEPGTCAPLCFGIPSYNTSVCSGLGTCSDVDSCQCFTGYSGPNCNNSAIYSWRGLNGSWNTMSNWVVGSFANGIAYRLPRDTDSIYFDQQGNYTFNYVLNTFPSFLSIGGTNSTVTFRLNTNQLLNGVLIINSNSIFRIASNSTFSNLNLTGSGSIFIEDNSSLMLSILQQTVLPSIISYGSLSISNSIQTFNRPVQIYGSSLTHTGTLNFNSNFEYISTNSLNLNVLNIAGNFISNSLKGTISFLSCTGSFINLSGDHRISDINFASNGIFTLKQNSSFSNTASYTFSLSSLILEDGSTFTLNGNSIVKTLIFNMFNSVTFTANGDVQIMSRDVNIQTNSILNFNRITTIDATSLSVGTGSIINFNHVSTLRLTDIIFSNNSIACTLDSTITSTNMRLRSNSKINFNSLSKINITNELEMSSSEIQLQSTSLSSKNLSLSSSNIYFRSDTTLTSRTINLQKSNMIQRASTALDYPIFDYSSALTATLNVNEFYAFNSKVEFGTLNLNSEKIQMNQTSFICTSDTTITSNELLIYDTSSVQFQTITFALQQLSMLGSSMIHQLACLINSNNINIQTSNITFSQKSNIIVSNDFTLTTSILLFSSETFIRSNSLSMILSRLSFRSSTSLQSIFFTCNSLLIFDIPATMNFQSVNLNGGILEFNKNINFNSTNLLQGGTIVLKSESGNFFVGDITSTKFVFNSATVVQFNMAKNRPIFTSVIIEAEGQISFFPGSNAQTPTIVLESSQLYFKANSRISQTIGFESSNSLIINEGFYLMEASNTGTFIATCPFLNRNALKIRGNSSIIYFTSQFRQESRFSTYTSFQIENNPTTIIRGNMTIDRSEIFLSGNIQADNLRIDNSTFYFDGTLNITGNFDLAPSTLFILLARSKDQNDFLTVSGHLKFAAFLYIKFDETFTPKIGDKRAFIKYGTASEFKNSVLFIGAAYRNAKILTKDNLVYLEIIFSLASTARGYSCHYLGNSKIIESNEFILENKIALTMTVPAGKGWSGFGFNTLNRTLMMLGLKKDAFQAFNHNSSIDKKFSTFIDVSTTEANSLFNIGPSYQSLSVFLSLSDMKGQSLIYYADTSSLNVNFTTTNGKTMITPSHDNVETFNFKIGSDKVTDCTNFLAPTRAEIYSPISFFAILGVYVISFVLWCSLVYFQPLKSRGISPLLTLLFLILQLSLEARNLFVIPAFQGSLCVYYAYGAFPLLEVNFIIVFIYFLRYFSIINLNETKNQFYKTEGKVETLTWKIKLLKYFSSIYFILIFTFVTLVIILIIFTIVLSIDSYVCRFSTLIALSTINNIELVIIYSLTILLFIIDIFINYKYTIISCRWIRYIIYNDPHYFRIQIVLFIPFMIFSMVFELYKFFTSFSFADIVTNFNSTLVMNTIMVSLLYFIDVFFPILITLFHVMQRCCRKKYKKDKLMEALQNPDIEVMFVEFCESEFSVENVLAWKDIQTYKKTKSLDLKEFYLKYLNGNSSIMELNVPRNVCDEINKMIMDGTVNDTIFDKLEQYVYGNLSETFSRFYLSKPYRAYQKAHSTKIELLDK